MRRGLQAPGASHGARGGPEPLPAAPAPPPRARMPVIPTPPAAPAAGRWVWTCRTGFEAHLFEELAWAGARPSPVCAGLVSSEPPSAGAPFPAFARTGFAVAGSARDALEAAELAGSWLSGGPTAPVAVHAWVPDTDEGNRLAPALGPLAEALGAACPGGPVEFSESLRRGGRVLQACQVPGGPLLLGLQAAGECPSPAPGGRLRMWRESGTSRASLKLEEALALLPVAPGRGETCADLGAAPGGWTERLLARGARVVAVDPARMAPHLEKHPKLVHVQDSAFAWRPEEPVDWLFCDMAWRPLEVAALLARFGRQRWATWLVANIKLPMHDKNPVLHRVRHVLEVHGGWQQLKLRQLYHDRDEVTVTAVRSGT